jgi:hypothetical protein
MNGATSIQDNGEFVSGMLFAKHENRYQMAMMNSIGGVIRNLSSFSFSADVETITPTSIDSFMFTRTPSGKYQYYCYNGYGYIYGYNNETSTNLGAFSCGSVLKSPNANHRRQLYCTEDLLVFINGKIEFYTINSDGSLTFISSHTPYFDNTYDIGARFGANEVIANGAYNGNYNCRSYNFDGSYGAYKYQHSIIGVNSLDGLPLCKPNSSSNTLYYSSDTGSYSSDMSSKWSTGTATSLSVDSGLELYVGEGSSKLDDGTVISTSVGDEPRLIVGNICFSFSSFGYLFVYKTDKQGDYGAFNIGINTGDYKIVHVGGFRFLCRHKTDGTDIKLVSINQHCS